MQLTVEQIIQACGATVVQRGTAAEVARVGIDSRTLQAGEWFVAIKGGHFDGHDFVASVIERGAAGVIVAGEENPSLPPFERGAVTPWILSVADTITALGAIAAAWRATCPAQRVAITGSNGKSTTKEMVAAIAAARGPVLKTEGNFNNLIGMPLTLFRLQPTDRTAVIEMGMSAFGEIAAMTQIAAPQVGLITNVAPAHLALLETVENVAKAKGELFSTMDPVGTIVVNQEDRFVRELATAFRGRQLRFGMQNGCDVQFGRMSSDGLGRTDLRLYVQGREYATEIPVPGTHNVMNALAATAVGLALEIAPDEIMARLPQFTPMRMRMERVQLENGVQVINDCYNANPLSMQMALRTVSVARRSGRFVAVLGDMLELGAEAVARHRDVGTQAAEAGVDWLYVCGAHAADIAAGARAAGMATERIVSAEDVEGVASAVEVQVRQGDIVLVKGSRGMKMERLVERLKTTFGVN